MHATGGRRRSISAGMKRYFFIRENHAVITSVFQPRQFIMLEANGVMQNWRLYDYLPRYYKYTGGQKILRRRHSRAVNGASSANILIVCLISPAAE